MTETGQLLSCVGRHLQLQKFDDCVYIPPYIQARDDGFTNSDGWERGMVSSTNGRFVFIKFYSKLNRFGWDGITAEACSPEDVWIVQRLNEP